MLGGLISEDAVYIESCMFRLYKGQGLMDLGLFILELVFTQGDVKLAQVKECPALNVIFIKVIQGCWLQVPCPHLGCKVCRSHWKLKFRCDKYILGCL
jgi:hypothetical protein